MERHKVGGTATRATGIRDSSKRTSGSADLSDSGEGVRRSGKVHVQVSPQALLLYTANRRSRKDLIDDTSDTDHDQFLVSMRSQPKSVSIRPSSLRCLQQDENIISSTDPARSATFKVSLAR